MNESTAIVVPGEEKLQGQGDRLLAMAREIRVTDQVSHQAATDFGVTVKDHLTKIDETFDPSIAQAHKTHKMMLGAKQVHTEKPRQAQGIIRNVIADYLDEQAQIRREAERKALDARRKAEQEKARQEEEAMRKAREAEEAGKVEEAEAILEEEIQAPIPEAEPVAPIPEAPKAQGSSARLSWSADVVDMKSLCRAIAEGRQSETLVKPNQTILDAMARSAKGTLDVPGVKAVSRQVVSFRGSR